MCIAYKWMYSLIRFGLMNQPLAAHARSAPERITAHPISPRRKLGTSPFGRARELEMGKARTMIAWESVAI